MILENPKVGVLFLIPQTSETPRINGIAELTCDPEILERLSARGKPALLAIRVSVEECFFHCGKAMLRSNLWTPEKWPERHRVSFGEMFAARKKLSSEVARTYDEAIAADYEQNL